MASSLPLDGRSFVLHWMYLLRTSLPAIDFGPRRDGITALPGIRSRRDFIVVSVQIVLKVLTRV